MQDSLSKHVHNATVDAHVLIRLQLNCIQSLSLVKFGTKLEWICAAYPDTDEGFVCVCVVVDYFSKWVEAKPSSEGQDCT